MTVSSSAGGTTPSNLYRAVWRWHFYAGLLSLPFLILLAVTGALYLFRDEIDGIVHRDLKQVEITAAMPQAPSALIAAAVASQPGATALKYLPPATLTASAEVGVKTADGGKLSVFVDPYSGRVLGALPDKGTVMGIVRRLHSLAYFGPVANGVIEITGGWCILLTLTGVYLWWPRPRRGEPGGVLTVRGTPKRRVYWRDLHAVTGAVAGVFILFLAVSGMPWSVLWGSYVNQWANGHNFGYPNGVRVNVPMSDDHLEHTTWSLEQARVPESPALAADPIGIDAAVAAFNRLGMAPGYSIALPNGPKGVYSASVYPDDLSRQRVVHLDQYAGTPLLDMSYADYGPLGKTLEWSINVHMGQEFGLANQLLMLAVCLSIVTVAISAGVMWWKRRPRGTLGVPPLPAEQRVLWGGTAILMVGSVIFPLVGASFLAMLVFDAVVIRRKSGSWATAQTRLG